MRTDRGLFVATLVATVIAVLSAIAAPNVAAVALGGVLSALILWRLGDWWRRAYVLTILAMFLGASHLPALEPLSGPIKIAALGLLLIATLGKVKGPGTTSGRLHRFTLGTLWVGVPLAFTSTAWSLAPAQTAIEAAIFAGFVFILHRVSTNRWSDRRIMTGDLAAGYWASTLMLAAGGVMATLRVGEAISTHSGRYQGLLNNPNLLGMISALTLALGVGVAMHRRNPLIWASLLIPASQLLLSQSRTAMLAAAAGLLWAVLRGGLGRVILMGGLAIIGSIVSVAAGFNPFGDALDRFGSREGGDLLNTRTLAWLDVVQYVQLNPQGIGWGATTDTLAEFNAAGLSSGLSSVHNSYLQIIFEVGVAGAVLALLLLGVFVTAALRSDVSGLGSGLVAVVVTGAIIQMAESAIFGLGQPYPYLFWFAVLAAVVNRAAPHQEAIKQSHTDRPRSLSHQGH